MERADICLVNLGLVKSRTHAKRIITEKRAFYNGKIIEKVSMTIEKPELISVKSTFEDSYVGRGAIKLDSAIKNFKLDLKNLVCITKKKDFIALFMKKFIINIEKSCKKL